MKVHRAAGDAVPSLQCTHTASEALPRCLGEWIIHASYPSTLNSNSGSNSGSNAGSCSGSNSKSNSKSNYKSNYNSGSNPNSNSKPESFPFLVSLSYPLVPCFLLLRLSQQCNPLNACTGVNSCGSMYRGVRCADCESGAMRVDTRCVSCRLAVAGAVVLLILGTVFYHNSNTNKP